MLKMEMLPEPALGWYLDMVIPGANQLKLNFFIAVLTIVDQYPKTRKVLVEKNLMPEQVLQQGVPFDETVARNILSAIFKLEFQERPSLETLQRFDRGAFSVYEKQEIFAKAYERGAVDILNYLKERDLVPEEHGELCEGPAVSLDWRMKHLGIPLYTECVRHNPACVRHNPACVGQYVQSLVRINHLTQAQANYLENESRC